MWAREMAQWIKASHQSLEVTLWKERTNPHGCSLTTCAVVCMCTYTFDFPWNSHVESSVPYADSMFLSLKAILTV